MKRPLFLVVAALAALLIAASVASAQTVSKVTVGSPPGNTPQNHQNEPAVAMDANHPNVLVAGTNDFVDNQACPKSFAINAGTCLDRATGVGVSGDRPVLWPGRSGVLFPWSFSIPAEGAAARAASGGG